MQPTTKEQVIEALRRVIYPNFEKDIIHFGFVSDIRINNNVCYMKIMIPSGNEEVISEVKKRVLEETSNLGFANVDIETHTPNTQKKQAAQSQETKNIAPSIKHFVMVSSGKGGVGKSTSSVNLAISLAKSGKKVGLLDADVYGPNIPRMLGLSDIKPDVSVDGKKLIPLEKFGVKIMSMGVLYDKGESLVWRGPLVMRALTQLLQDVDWDELDIMVIDMPPGTGDAQLTIAQSVPVGAGINVTTPQMVAIDDGERALDMFVKCQIPIFGIIENMSGFICPNCNNKYDIFGSGNSNNLANHFNTKVVAKIPLEPKIVESSDIGKPISFYQPDSLVSQAYMQCAAMLIDFLENTKADNKTIQPIQ
ncbi:MRP family ATP-binding protein [Helicobacter muridarum]|uniref:Iron-sulfur cluster carrier protein n=1 Tax=Helicobacter muridarum TaxID=216 RepID=A0A099U1J8_9HELI|nr:Mrp/NBP35 family ATP-binding protein [Helicobacter muridarum]TLE00034.1 MRP family ATP-binding protein [Helicobacter muridarum]STQ86121.1 ATP/GTP-binding protein [Helicobacter muridarum]